MGLTIGQPILYRKPLHRVAENRERRWVPYGHDDHWRQGHVIGLRTLTNGTVTYYGYDGPTEYTPTETVAAVLVVESLRSKPVRVRPEDVKPVGDDGTE